MSKQAKKSAKLKGGLEVNPTRPDVQAARQPESSYIFKPERRPNLQNRERWTVESFQRGMDLESIVRGSGYPVGTVYRLCGLDIEADRTRYDELVRIRTEMIMKGK